MPCRPEKSASINPPVMSTPRLLAGVAAPSLKPRPFARRRRRACGRAALPVRRRNLRPAPPPTHVVVPVATLLPSLGYRHGLIHARKPIGKAKGMERGMTMGRSINVRAQGGCVLERNALGKFFVNGCESEKDKSERRRRDLGRDARYASGQRRSAIYPHQLVVAGVMT